MGFGILACVNLPECRRLPHGESGKPLKANNFKIGSSIAIRRVPVMYRLLDEFRPAQRTRDARQEQPPTKRPSKGKTAGEVSSRCGGNNHRPQIAWEASDQRRTVKRHPEWGGVFRVRGPIWAWRELAAANSTCQPGRFAVISDLPIKRLTRATRNGKSKLAAGQGNFSARFNS
jgi:hypothetical protein